MSRRYLDEDAAADYCCISVDSLKKATKSGDLARVPGMVIDGKRLTRNVYTVEELDRWMTDDSTLAPQV